MASKVSVEAAAGPAIKGRTAGRAFRQCRAPTPSLVVDRADLAGTAQALAAKVAEVGRARGCGAFLFVDEADQAYVVNEEHAAAMEWVRDRFDWLVGFYSNTGRRFRGVAPFAPPDIAGDLAEHLGIDA